MENVLILLIILPFVGALISFLIGLSNERLRDIFTVILTACELLLLTLIWGRVQSGGMELYVPDIMGTGLYLKLDVFRYVFVWITSLIWFLTTIYSTQYILKYKNRNRYYTFFILTFASTIGIFISENILNLFTFFEIMSITSYILVIHDEDRYTHEAGRTYIGMAIGGGLILLMGLFLLFDYTATLNISEIPDAINDIGNIKYLISSLMIIGFGVKASIVPLHIWLPKAHPAAPAPASAVLSGILVKTGIFGIIITVNIIMNGDFILSSIIMGIGFVNMILGGFLALFQRNIKRILAYSSMSQIGYILLGIGLIGLLKEHKIIAIYGVVMHIFNHAIFKVLLFLVVGIIYMIIHDVSINVVRGFGKHKGLLKAVFIVGALAIMGIPGTNGFISKTILHDALSEAHHQYDSYWFVVAEVLFVLGSSLTVAYLMKIFVAVFVDSSEKYIGQYKDHIRKRAILPMVILSIMVFYIGINPNLVLKFMTGIESTFGVTSSFHIDFYSFDSLKSTMIVLVIGLFIYFGFVKKYLLKIIDGKKMYVNPSLNWISLEKDIYLPVLKAIYRTSSDFFHIIDNSAINVIKNLTIGIKKLSEFDFEEEKNKKINKEVSVGMSKIEGIKDAYGNIRDQGSEKAKGELTNFLISVRNKMNSIIYSIFIFALILVIFLVSLVLLNR
ncbi:MAG: hypothetical protein FH761_03700 [Firmicutes bacterium]|nr:hypothetical protein [Bacillota bacterium]